MSRSSWARTNSAQSAGEPRAGAIAGGSIDAPPLRGDLPARPGGWGEGGYPVPHLRSSRRSPPRKRYAQQASDPNPPEARYPDVQAGPRASQNFVPNNQCRIVPNSTWPPFGRFSTPLYCKGGVSLVFSVQWGGLDACRVYAICPQYSSSLENE